ncbi:MAG: outer membrane lipoprotein chaperone LolA [Gammaproteobacteria bacterium]|jgi:outer membrane lipoprotein carrier protein|nr:outer membrane lipoprotein chaperone LolA [Gammaproteobacteria bacterium]MBT3488614.1 outer membrane lipoprotein chaperone LolA [Gammaproteobacteria bacterium]MBT3717730.1 outer membrane lipoprotein chaperone LolA [Gammaproteobacteria bacterium]MBT3844104.1 outer membrane lipoprotein chaperone LolA [Gammaproteobacteria bacterium]MBT3893836.1 outer membrane lipoprotein chaperone LolA [Gammaproteobacteria bacterium]
MMRPWWIFLLLPTLAWGGESSAIEDFLTELRSLQGDFQQQVRDGSGQLIEQSAGQLLLQRPGQFRWETTTPFAQQVVADGNKIWIYDPDLEQVTVRRQQGALTNTPATLLTHAGALTEQFSLKHIERTEHLSENLQWVALQPLQQEGGFEQLLVAMDGEQLRVIEVEDSFGQRTRIEFSNLMLNISLPAELFRFVPPAGVDVVGDL